MSKNYYLKLINYFSAGDARRSSMHFLLNLQCYNSLNDFIEVCDNQNNQLPSGKVGKFLFLKYSIYAAQDELDAFD